MPGRCGRLSLLRCGGEPRDGVDGIMGFCDLESPGPVLLFRTHRKDRLNTGVLALRMTSSRSFLKSAISR